MVKIEIYSLLDGTVCSVETKGESHQDSVGTWTTWHSLAYVRGPRIEHSETDAMQDLVQSALEAAEKSASERGGWSALV